MAKTYTTVTQSGLIAAVVAQKTTVVNTSSDLIFITDSETDEALNTLEFDKRIAVLSAMHSIPVNGSRSLAAGTYNLSFKMWNGSAVIVREF